MASRIETGHSKNVTNFETLLAQCTAFGEKYNPSNEELSLEQLTVLYNEAKLRVNEVKRAKSPYDDAVGVRATAFKTYKSLSTKVVGALISSGAPSTVINDAETIKRRMSGSRAPGSKEKFNPDGSAIDRNSVSQQSFDLKIDHFEKLVELLAIEPRYRPNENNLKVDSLKDYLGELEQKNTLVKNTYQPYSRSMNDRDRKLYDPTAGLVAKSKSVKSYLKSVFGTKAPEYIKANKIPFRTMVKIEEQQ